MEDTSIQLSNFSNPLNRCGLNLHLEYQGSSYHLDCQYTRSDVTVEKESKIELSMQGATMDYGTQLVCMGFDGVPQQLPSSYNHVEGSLFYKNLYSWVRAFYFSSSLF